MADTGLPWELPYPLPTDLVKDGADAIKDLAEAVAGGLDLTGRVLQVVRGVDLTLRTTTSTSFVDAGVSVSITPKQATSTILLIWICLAEKGAAGEFIRLRITDASDVSMDGAVDALMGSTVANQMNSNQVSIAFQSAGSTAARTYKARFRSTNGNTVTLVNNANGGQLYAMEVAS